MVSTQQQDEILQNTLRDLIAKGYEVYSHPTSEVIPNFLGQFKPDAIAIASPNSNKKNLVIEIKHHAEKKVLSSNLEAISKLVNNQDHWEFFVVYVDPIKSRNPVRIQNNAAILKGLKEVWKLTATSQNKAAVLLAWATLEAVGRRLKRTSLQVPQSPGRLTEELTSKGYILQNQAEWLRRMATKRNAIIHGDLSMEASSHELLQFIKLLEVLIAKIPTMPSPSPKNKKFLSFKSSKKTELSSKNKLKINRESLKSARIRKKD